MFAGVAERDVYLPEHARRVTANIYDFNTQSRKMFLSLDFQQTGKEWYVLDLRQGNPLTVMFSGRVALKESKR